MKKVLVSAKTMQPTPYKNGKKPIAGYRRAAAKEVIFAFALTWVFISASVCFSDVNLVDVNTRPATGRKNVVYVLPVESEIMYEIETAAFEQAISQYASKNPGLILVEIDTPGGRVDLAQRMSAAITKTANCRVIAFIKGGQYGGAISAGSAIALACNKIYMASNTIIGAATLLTVSEQKELGIGERVAISIDEKMNSMWRAYLASLAQRNNRPGLMARAMVDRNLEVIEVNDAGKRLFIEPINKQADQQVVRSWNRSGTLLTLTAQEAVECSIADGLAGTRDELLRQLGLSDANVVVDKRIANARKELDIIGRRLAEIRKSLDLKVKQAQTPQPTPKALAILRGAKADFEILITLAKKYPDLNFDIPQLENELNSINVAYENILRESKSRK
ncbi:MAG: hypothetical protein JW749_05725 [Sedimentisphaerales bacterium]|nr:hypothetical protein [Sedimentisphaerales bacterium]